MVKLEIMQYAKEIARKHAVDVAYWSSICLGLDAHESPHDTGALIALLRELKRWPARWPNEAMPHGSLQGQRLTGNWHLLGAASGDRELREGALQVARAPSRLGVTPWVDAATANCQLRGHAVPSLRDEQALAWFPARAWRWCCARAADRHGAWFTTQKQPATGHMRNHVRKARLGSTRLQIRQISRWLAHTLLGGR